MFISISPAYGRTYKSGREAALDWANGKDFILEPQGCYCSVRDFDPKTSVEIHDHKGHSIATIPGAK